LFEITFALKYLLPRGKSLSTALISLMSVLVISLVVWLVLVFLSVTAGIEKNWLAKLTTVHAPLRISPTEDYYRSYYYKIDGLTAASGYTFKTIGEKAESPLTDPYAADLDMELPPSLPKFDKMDPVKAAYRELDALGLTYQDYEISGALLRMGRDQGMVLSQMSYLLSEPNKNPNFDSLILERAHLKGPQIPVLLPKNFKDNGVKIGDLGSLNYTSITAASSQEQKIPIQVDGFYDPGLLSNCNKCLIVPKEITRTIHMATQTFSPDGTPTNGIFIWLSDLKEAPLIQEKIRDQFAKAGISQYWKVDSYKDFEFSKDLLLQFQSDKTLFLLIATIILLVACCNIISLLVLLVNDKKKEIAILQSMGASFTSIAAIFGLCGILTGILSCLLGSALAVFTLKNIGAIVQFLSALQGHNAFNPVYFGQTLPSDLSFDALLFVLVATPILSLAAGLIPAIKASRIRPATVLRSE
jgi:lipoprotein-releasing system permease protein